MRPFTIEVRWLPLGEPVVEWVPRFKGPQRMTESDLREAWIEIEDGLRAFASGRLQSLREEEVSLCSKHGPWVENEQGCPGCVSDALLGSLAAAPEKPKESAERAFLSASIAVWREIDRLSATGEYKGLSSGTALRIRERKAWERYRETLGLEPKKDGA